MSFFLISEVRHSVRKSDKKIDNQVRQALTEVCELALQHINGYLWITHTANYQRFPDSLIITCMFADKESAHDAQQQGELLKIAQQKLQQLDINLKAPNKQLRFQFESN